MSKYKVFHGGCLSCVSQIEHGIDRCSACKYKNANWDLPDLSIEKEDFHLGIFIHKQEQELDNLLNDHDELMDRIINYFNENEEHDEIIGKVIDFFNKKNKMKELEDKKRKGEKTIHIKNI